MSLILPLSPTFVTPPKRILCLFDFNANTGFATVSKNIVDSWLAEFGDKLQIDICAINYFGEPYNYAPNVRVVSAVKSSTKHDDFGRFGFLQILKEEGADDEGNAVIGERGFDAIFIMQDVGVIMQIIPLLSQIKVYRKMKNLNDFKSMFYFPVDFALYKDLVIGLEFFDILATYTEYGKEQVLKLRPELKSKKTVIPHGNNKNDYYPIPENESIQFRKEYFGEDSVDKFIITNVNRNQPRKDIPSTILAFIEAKKKWNISKKPFLYLHMNPVDPMGYKLRHLFSQTDLIETVDYMLTPKHIENHGASIEMLRNIYNASDLYVTTNLGEGWGLTVTEAMACKLPTIVPLHTSMTEISNSGERSYVMTELYPFASHFDNVFREQCNIYELADLIIEAANKRKEGTDKEMIDKAYQYISMLEWKVVGKRFCEYLKELVKI